MHSTQSALQSLADQTIAAFQNLGVEITDTISSPSLTMSPTTPPTSPRSWTATTTA